MYILIGCLAALWTLAGQNPDEAAVRAVVSSYMDARQSKDPRQIEALFTADADQLISSGEWRRGRDEVVRGTLTSSRANEGKRTISVVALRFVSPDVAIVDGRYELASSSGDVRRMWTTLVLRRGPGGWQISAVRNMLPAPPSPPNR